jgi:hypothetical protein
MFHRLSQWFKSRSRPHRQHPATTRKHRVLPNLEILEDRTVPTTVINVTSTDDFLGTVNGLVSLRSAIQQANTIAGSYTINLTVPGTYQISLAGTAGENDNQAGEFAIIPSPNNTLTITNTSGGAVTIDAKNFARVFDINPGAAAITPAFSVTFENFTIQNGLVATGNNGAGIQAVGNINLTLTNMIVTNNVATGISSGGGIFVNGPVLTINNSTISNNLAGTGGGGIDNAGTGAVAITSSTIVNNNAGSDSGGAIKASAGTVAIIGSIIANNIAQKSGGAIFVAGPTLAVANSTIGPNNKSMDGGGIELNTTGSGTTGSSITNTTITGNIASNNGGGIDAPAAFTGSVSLVYDTINGNSAANGGGVFWNAGAPLQFLIQNTIIAQNTAIVGPDVDNAGTKYSPSQ